MKTRVRLRPTMTSDIAYVLSLERDPSNLPFITPWDKPQHEGAIRFADMRHFIIEAVDGRPGLDAIGFAILIGCRNPHHSLELKRIVVGPKGEGFGRAAVKMLKKIAFDELHAHRFWLDVKSRNERALALYADEGFIREGVLRDAVLSDQGRESLVVMSMLKAEFDQRRADRLELGA